MSPIDYTSAFADLPAPGDSFLKGLQGGLAIRQVQAQQQQQQAALDQQQRQQQVIRQLIANPAAGAEEYANAALLVPGMSEQFKQAWETKSTAAAKQHLSDLSQWGAALQNKQPQIVIDAMNERADAMENTANGPTRESQALRAQAQTIKEHPEFGGFMIKSMLAAHPDGKNVVDAISALGVEQRAQDLHGSAVREADAKADGEVADAAKKNLGIVAQKAGALAKPGVKPSQAITMFKSLEATGVIPKGGAQEYIDNIPSDPKALPEYLRQVQAAGLSANEQRKYTDVDANTAATNARIAAEGAADRKNRLEIQDRIERRAEAKADVEPTLSPSTLKSMAEQYLAGDPAAIQNLGRGAQGAANLVAVRNQIAELADARGMDGAAIAAKLADYGGLKAGMRTSANISARVENAISEARELIPLAVAASAEVSRSGLLPFGKAGVMFNTQTNDPALKKFVTANNGLVSAYAGAMARGQKPTVNDYQHAREMLLEAQNHEAYVAVTQQMNLEMDAASRAPQNVREHLRGEISGGGKGHGPAVGTVDGGYRFKGGDPSKRASWEKI